MKRLKNVFEKFNMEWNEEKEDKYSLYMEAVLEKNRHINLTAITDRDEFIRKHYIDSLLCCGSAEFLKAESIIDVGTGGGFPGVPLAIAFPEKNFLLMDSLNKRLKVIDELTANIGIDNVNTLHGRAEEMARKNELRESFDLCVSRAVANMSTLSEYCLPFVKVGGMFIAYKGPDCDNEIKQAHRAIEIMGGEILRKEALNMDGYDLDHTLVFVSKVKNTASKYPRKAGIPSKEPVK